MKEKEIISVIIPSYNNAPYIKEAIESAINIIEVKEVIVVDDCSTDDTRDILQSINNTKLNLTFLEKNNGVSYARNVGITKVSTSLIAFLDSDDFFLENRFTKDLKLFQDPSVDITYNALGSYNQVTKRENELITTLSKDYHPDDLLDVFTGYTKEPGHLSLDVMTFRKECFKSFRFNTDLFLGEDTELILKMSARYNMRAGEIISPRAIRRIHTKNSSLIQSSYFYSQRSILYSSLATEIGEELPLKNLNLIRSHYYKFTAIEKNLLGKIIVYFKALITFPRLFSCTKFHYENLLIHIPFVKKLKEVIKP